VAGGIARTTDTRLDAPGVSAEVTRSALADRRAALTPRAPILATAPASMELSRLTLFRDRRPLAALRIHADLAVCAMPSGLLVHTRALLEDRLLLLPRSGGRASAPSALGERLTPRVNRDRNP
jgi:hypothetical protein